MKTDAPSIKPGDLRLIVTPTRSRWRWEIQRWTNWNHEDDYAWRPLDWLEPRKGTRRSRQGAIEKGIKALYEKRALDALERIHDEHVELSTFTYEGGVL